MLTTAAAAALLGVSRARVLTLIHLGTLNAEKPGRDWQVDEASVEAYRLSPRKAGRKPRQFVHQEWTFDPANVAASVATARNSGDVPQSNAEEQP